MGERTTGLWRCFQVLANTQKMPHTQQLLRLTISPKFQPSPEKVLYFSHRNILFVTCLSQSEAASWLPALLGMFCLGKSVIIEPSLNLICPNPKYHNKITGSSYHECSFRQQCNLLKMRCAISLKQTRQQGFTMKKIM